MKVLKPKCIFNSHLRFCRAFFKTAQAKNQRIRRAGETRLLGTSLGSVAWSGLINRWFKALVHLKGSKIVWFCFGQVPLYDYETLIRVVFFPGKMRGSRLHFHSQPWAKGQIEIFLVCKTISCAMGLHHLKIINSHPTQKKDLSKPFLEEDDSLDNKRPLIRWPVDKTASAANRNQVASRWMSWRACFEREELHFMFNIQLQRAPSGCLHSSSLGLGGAASKHKNEKQTKK